MEKNHKQLWDECLAIIADNIPQEQFDSWFRPISSISFEDGNLTLGVPSAFFVEHLESCFMRIIATVLRRVYGPDVKLLYRYKIVNSEPSSRIDTLSKNPSPAVQNRQQEVNSANPFITSQPVDNDLDSQLNPTLTFENYLGGESNKLARSIGEAIAADPKCKTFNPLFVFGPSGVGKTHLIQAIGIRIKEKNPAARILYITARLFESQFTVASRNGKINDFTNFYQSIDTLIIDDIQDLMGKEKTQQAFFHIFNFLHLNHRQIILASDCCPSDLKGMPERLLTRFKWGMTVELERPDLDLRRQVLRLKAAHDGINLPPDVLDYIAANVTDSIRELEGIVVSLMASATFLNKEITVDLARRVVNHSVRTARRTINFEMIAESVSEFYNIDIDRLFTKTRKREVSDARQMVMFLCKKHINMAVTAIGTRLSRNHATVHHAIKTIEDRLPIDKKLQEDITAIEHTFTTSHQ